MPARRRSLWLWCPALVLLTAPPSLDAQPESRRGVVAGYVVDSMARRTLPAAIVESGMIRGIADSTGRFALSLPAGVHRLRVMHKAIDELGDISLPDHVLTVIPDDTVFVEIGIPSGPSLRHALCGASSSSGVGVIVGTVRDAVTDAPIEDAEVVVAWSEVVLSGGAEGTAPRVFTRRTRSASSGQYRLCDVPNDFELGAKVRHGKRHEETFALALEGRAFTIYDLSMRTGDTDSVVHSSRIVGRLRSRGTAVPDAAVFLFGREHLVTSDSTGRFVLDAVPGGSQTLEIRKLGFAPHAIVLNIRPSRDLSIDVELDQVRQLATRTVEARPIAIWDSVGFHERRMRGHGTFIDGAQLQSGVVDFKSAMRSFSSQTSSGNSVQLSGALATGGARCVPTFFVDGTRIDEQGSSAAPQWLRPEQIRAMEIYRTPGQVPPRFSRPDICAAIVVWTRNRFLEEEAARTTRPPR